MSQADALRTLDATIFSAMAGAGLADAAGYWPKGAPPDALPTPCSVLVDRDTRVFGDDESEVATVHTVITFQRVQVEPERGARVAIGAEVFKLEAELSKDESRARWVVMK